jgi:hypothetical protein
VVVLAGRTGLKNFAGPVAAAGAKSAEMVRLMDIGVLRRHAAVFRTRANRGLSKGACAAIAPAHPYPFLARKFYTDSKERQQQLVPFLGAGASLGNHSKEDLELTSTEPIVGLGFSSDGQRLATLDARGAVRVYRLAQE